MSSSFIDGAADTVSNFVLEQVLYDNYLELGDNIGKEPLEVLTKSDCINLFYNLLCAELPQEAITVLSWAMSCRPTGR